jgi:hypothetical protein
MAKKKTTIGANDVMNRWYELNLGEMDARLSQKGLDYELSDIQKSIIDPTDLSDMHVFQYDKDPMKAIVQGSSEVDKVRAGQIKERAREFLAR